MASVKLGHAAGASKGVEYRDASYCLTSVADFGNRHAGLPTSRTKACAMDLAEACSKVQAVAFPTDHAVILPKDHRKAEEACPAILALAV